MFRNRANWAHDRLKRAGLSGSAKRGYWVLTKEGFDYAAKHSAPLSPEEVEHLAVGFMDVKLKASGDGAFLDQEVVEAPSQEASTASPDDRLEQALKELRGSIASDLLERLKQTSPSRFEVIVLDVLHRLGYGASRDDLQRVGGSGDGEIDGIISLDKLGLEKVYVQAKRWQAALDDRSYRHFMAH
jgi:restriction system protein